MPGHCFGWIGDYCRAFKPRIRLNHVTYAVIASVRAGHIYAIAGVIRSAACMGKTVFP